MKEYIFFSFLNKQKCQYLWFENDLCRCSHTLICGVISITNKNLVWLPRRQ